MVGSGAGAVTPIGPGATGTVLKGNTGADPSYGQVDLTTDVTGILPVPNGGTGLATITDHGVMVGSGAGAVTPLAVGTNGQLLIGSTGADPVWAALTSSGGTITVTGGAGTLNVDTAAAVPTSFTCDAGSAVPALGVLTVAGGNDISTSGALSMIPFTMPNKTLAITMFPNRHRINRLLKKARKIFAVYFLAFELADFIFLSVACLP